MVIGAGKGGYAIINLLKANKLLKVVAVIDPNLDAPGIQLAKQLNIPCDSDWRNIVYTDIDIIIDVTGNDNVYRDLQANKPENCTIIPGAVAFILVTLMKEKEQLIEKLKNKAVKDDLIFNSINDGMIVIDHEGLVSTFNLAAELITNISKKDALGKPIQKVIPTSKLPIVLETLKPDINQEWVFANGKKAIVTRIPIIEGNGDVLGAFAVFKDITEVLQLANEITNLREIQTMLEAIIQSSNDAISVVDEEGKGILINPAYTRLTGLTEDEVIGKPATTDIYEGDSMHMQVLKTKQPVRGAKMLVGPNKKEVVVNVAPIIVDKQLKGSVGIIHDMSEIRSLNLELEKARERIRKLEAKYTFDDIIGQSEEMVIAIEQAKIGSKTPATVLLRGESGTGKELFAHAIHNESDRRFNSFIRVNCAALSESLLESELFGYEEGAFSGAKRGGKRGLFEEANNGSIFLDEIGEMSLSTQAKLLRILQEKEIVRVGGTKSIAINTRIIAATNLNLEKEVSKGNFREDLYYRLNRIPIHIPPLRERLEDIPALSKRLIQKINADYGRTVEGISKHSIEVLQAYHWPGNVRELENILGRAIIFMNYNDTIIDIKFLPNIDKRKGLRTDERVSKSEIDGNLQELLDQYERQIIADVLQRNQGNKTKTADDLKISIRNLYYKIDKYNL